MVGIFKGMKGLFRDWNRWLIAAFFMAAALIGVACLLVPPVIAVGAAGFILAVLLFWKRPEWGLYIIIITLPVYYDAYVVVYGLNIRIYNALSIIIAVILLLRSKLSLPMLFPILVFLGCLGLSVINSMDQLLSAKYILFQFFGFLLMWITYSLTNNQKDLDRFIYLLLIIGNIDVVLICINTILYLAHLPTFAPIMFTDVLPIGRPNLFLGEPDRTAEYHLVLLMMTFPFILLIRRWKVEQLLKSRFLLVSFLLNLYIVLVGLFRSAWIGLGVGVALYILLSFKDRFARIAIKRLIPIGIVGFLILAGFLIVFSSFTNAMLQRFNEAVDLVVHPRLDVQSDFSVIYVFFQRGLRRPWFGWGIGFDEVAINPATTFTYYNAAISEGYNRLIRMFFGAGIVGILGFVFWQAAYLRRMTARYHQFAYRMAMLIPVIGIYWGHDMIRAVSILPLIFIVMGMGLSLLKIHRMEAIQPAV
jgi:hypothetical protein